MTQIADGIRGARVLLGVSGGIAAYKAAHVVRGLVASGADVRVVPTASSLEFVGAATWEALSHHPVTTSVFEDVDEVAHVRLGQEADLVLVVPATADLLARVRGGRADDLLSATLLMAGPRALLAPAMHTEMWENPATRENVAVLRERGVRVLEPAVGRLTGPDSGPGRLPEPEAILEAARAQLTAPRDEHGAVVPDLEGARVLISAGGTREEIDPVRFLANHSSGKQGFALAHAALARGAEVTLIAANVDLETPPGARRVDVTSAADLASAVAAEREGADALVMAAAVADFTPAQRAEAKIKKTGEDDVPALALRRTQDVLAASVSDRRERRDQAAASAGTRVNPHVIVGFAAETGGEGRTSLELAREKARRKQADLLVFNDVSRGVFGAEDTAIEILDAEGADVARAEGSKTAVAHAVLTQVASRLGNVRWTP
ncbi:bifunctional phosphopantothenoylcysteine decarboxylase/phosphopantothenate--cysteine ligase CoaBC [Brachybacterium sp. ACRRE]|uniref:bifunctional phosphopantothenoylcysteine decarboxylase/phosphopantothenate--cysteine ligase CoaBC n=1 Tax=Brachybacterium sp. ACRRE TaxID=2918184 RepID=UPI001EF39969|nr:bifunctional phosphopantothenoylcysteine decarboxylase/phosphopantothenate--cysteine ligase CoaBC [Brachybacterium sp. ACRRE]MCG7311243.1 bifunctional phosphopantothenoylcysteine decarboxylase/phosphopantothenate--cysteine ligase CoaBC [Brachybacterium sp. ACRRE]